MRRYNAVMRSIIAVSGRVFVRCISDHLDDHPVVLFLTERNVRIEGIIKFFKLDDSDESGRRWLAIEAEHRFLIRAASLGCSFSRLCDGDARFDDLGCFRCVCRD